MGRARESIMGSCTSSPKEEEAKPDDAPKELSKSEIKAEEKHNTREDAEARVAAIENYGGKIDEIVAKMDADSNGMLTEEELLGFVRVMTDNPNATEFGDQGEMLKPYIGKPAKDLAKFLKESPSGMVDQVRRKYVLGQ